MKSEEPVRRGKRWSRAPLALLALLALLLLALTDGCCKNFDAMNHESHDPLARARQVEPWRWSQSNLYGSTGWVDQFSLLITGWRNRGDTWEYGRQEVPVTEISDVTLEGVCTF